MNESLFFAKQTYCHIRQFVEFFRLWTLHSVKAFCPCGRVLCATQSDGVERVRKKKRSYSPQTPLNPDTVSNCSAAIEKKKKKSKNLPLDVNRFNKRKHSQKPPPSPPCPGNRKLKSIQTSQPEAFQAAWGNAKCFLQGTKLREKKLRPGPNQVFFCFFHGEKRTKNTLC